MGEIIRERTQCNGRIHSPPSNFGGDFGVFPGCVSMRNLDQDTLDGLILLSFFLFCWYGVMVQCTSLRILGVDFGGGWVVSELCANKDF